jgi:hypothetical protein
MTNDKLTSSNTTRFRQKVLSSSWCIGIWHGCHTLTRGKAHYPLTPQMCKTSPQPDSLLLSNVHTSWKKLWHIWMRTIGHYEILSPLATISGMDKRTVHDPHQPCQPAILEISRKSQQTNGTMACRPLEIWLWNQTHPWQYQHTGRCSIMTTKSRPRKGRQPKHSNHSTWEVSN